MGKRLATPFSGGQRGDSGILFMMLVGSVLVGVFFLVKDWIKDTKDRRHSIGEYAYSEESDTTPIKQPTVRHYGSYYSVTY